ncbi:hypothetical protein Tco_0061658 [Tanacetum coccineum]
MENCRRASLKGRRFFSSISLALAEYSCSLFTPSVPVVFCASEYDVSTELIHRIGNSESELSSDSFPIELQLFRSD